MIKNVVFDIGSVLLGFDWDRYVRRIFDNDEEVCDAVTKYAFECPYWKEMDRGEMEQPEILAKMIEQAPQYESQILECVERVDECVERLDYSIPWIEGLKARGYKVYFLSNYSFFVLAKSMHALDFLPHTDGGIFSCDVKAIKPDEEIYEDLFEEYGLKPEECVFIDDMPANIDTAKRLGMKGIVFGSHEQADADLNALLAAEGEFK